MIESVLLPLISVLLPWQMASRFYWWVAGWNTLYRDQVAAPEVSGRPERLVDGDRDSARRTRYHLLVDQADFYLSCFRGKRWLKKYVRVVGDPVDCEQGALFITFHWGQGFWALKYLNQLGFKPAWLHAPLQRGLNWGSTISGLVGRGRIAQVGRLSGAEPIAVGNSIEKMHYRLVEQQRSVLAMPDAPLREGASALKVRLLGREAQLPAGVIRLAARNRIPVYAYTMIVNPEDGTRCLSMRGPVEYDSEETLAQALANILTEAIEREPAAWYVWPFADSFFRSADVKECIA